MSLDISTFTYNSCARDIGTLTHESHHCATCGCYLPFTQTRYIQLCLFSLYPASLWLHEIESRIMSSGTSGSGWPPSITPNDVEEELDIAPDVGPTYGGYTGHNDVAASQYSGESSHPGNFFPPTSGFPIAQPTSMVSPTYFPQDIQYSYGNLDSVGTIPSPNYQDQSP